MEEFNSGAPSEEDKVINGDNSAENKTEESVPADNAHTDNMSADNGAVNDRGENMQSGYAPSGNMPYNAPVYGGAPQQAEQVQQGGNAMLNGGGGIYAERDFAAEAAREPYAAAQQYAYAAGSSDGMYRQMYAGAAQNMQNMQGGMPNGMQGMPSQQPTPYTYINENAGMNGGGQQPCNNGYAQAPQYSYNGYAGAGQPAGSAADSGVPVGAAPLYQSYYPPQMEAVSELSQKEMKKSSKAWLIVIIILLIVMICGVMVLLAFTHKDDKNGTGGKVFPDTSVTSSNSGGGSGVTVNISVAPKPVDDETFYRNKETGELTPAGAAHQVLPSIVSLYGYTQTIIQHSSEASGIIISEDGYIITNAHAVEDVSRMKARLNDGREFEAKIIGYDARSDLAVIKIEADNIIPAVIGRSGDMLQGEEVMSIGNAGGYNDTVTVGSVSYVDREVTSYTGYPMKCIQTDAALNAGTSGGALVNMYGQVIGIVVSKNSSSGNENLGFAISTDFAVPIIEDLIANGYVKSRGRIGIIYTFIPPETAEALEVKPGLLISEIDPDCDVAKSGLQVDDIITELDGAQMLTSNDVVAFQSSHMAGDVVTAKVFRKGIDSINSEFEITFRLEEQTN